MEKNQEEIQSNIIKTFEMLPHPEGGHFKEVCKSPYNIQNKENETRPASSLIYFLLCKKETSYWHRLKAEEIWHFYDGSPLIIHTFDEITLKKNEYILGNKLLDNKSEFTIKVNDGLWFGASVLDKMGHSFVGCTMAPGFSYEDFELADRASFESKYPQLKGIL